MTIDRSELEEALEIACGNDIGRDITSRRTASQNNIDRLRSALRRFIRELPPDTMIHEIQEALDEQ